MLRIVSSILAAAFAAVVGLSPLVGSADAACKSTAECPNNMTCQSTVFGKECKILFCNADTECPSDRPSCLNGACMSTTSGGTGGSTSGGISPSGVGSPCGPQRFGQATKQVPCQQGLLCVNGRCQRPPT